MKAEDILRIRNKQKLTQEQMAAVLNTSSQTVSRWERGVVSPMPVFVRALKELDKTRQATSKTD